MKCMVIDGNSIVNRAFYGVSQNLTTREGLPTNAIFGFVNILLKLLEEEQPVPVQTRMWERIKLILFPSLYSAAPMVYSSTTRPLTRCSLTMEATFSGVIFT